MREAVAAPPRGAGATARVLWLATPSALAAPLPPVAPDGVILDLWATPSRQAEGGIEPLVARAKSLSASGWVAVRLSPLREGRMDAELDALLPAWPGAVLVPDCADGRDVQHCGVKLAVREALAGRPAGSTTIVAAPGAAGLLAPRGFAGASARLIALALDGAALEAALGAAPGTLARGDRSAELMRGLLLLGARAAGVEAYDAPAAMEDAAFLDDCRRARRLGFDGRIGRDAAEVAAIAAVFAARGGVSPDG